MSYEQLDVIADAYIPLLILISIGVVVLTFRQRTRQHAKNRMLVLALGVCQTYAVMVLDSVFSIWPQFGLDYSTHTSLALVFVVFLSCVNRKLFAVATFSMAFYVLLMLYQGYHSLLDVVTTSIVVLPGLVWLNVALIYKREEQEI